MVKLEDYHGPHISKALQKCFDLLGGIQNIISPRSKVFVKINHLSPPSPPSKAIITHPYLTREVLRFLKDLECQITVGDDIQSSQKNGTTVSGYRQMCEKMGVNLVNLKEVGFQEISCSGAKLKRLHLSPRVLEADCLINLPKLKTHSFTVFTGAVKNMYGMIPYGRRLHYHRQFSLPDDFAQMLVDIYACIPPHFTIMDAVVAMEGEGPSAGQPRKTKTLLASEDGVAVDAVSSKMVGFHPMDIPTTYHAHQRFLGNGDMNWIQVLGEDLNHRMVKDFKHSEAATGMFRRRTPQLLYALIQGQLTLIPEIIPQSCTGCQECIRICPTGAARSFKGKAWIHPGPCIHCMCCHEVCRFQAIKLKMRPVGKIVRKGISLTHRIRSLWK